MADQERNRLTARAARYASVGANVGGVAARMAGARFLGMDLDRARNAAELAAALGGLKGPIMKVAQLLATIPEALPPEYIAELHQAAEPGAADGLGLRQAPHAGRAWRRLAERNSQASSIIRPPRLRSARCIARRRMTARSWPASCSIADMQSAVEADLRQLGLLFAIRRRFDPAIDTTEMIKEIGARMREELDYRREAKHVALYRDMLADERSRPRAATSWPELSTGRLLTLDWLEGTRMLEHKDDPLAVRNRLAQRDVHRLVAAVQPLRRDPRRSASRQLHGVRREGQARRHQPARLRLHPHLPAVVRRRRGRSLQRAARRRRRRASCMPTRPGASGSCRAS